MIDIHCHILSGLDDGAGDLQVSVDMARMAYEDGIRHIVATPHFFGKYVTAPGTILEKIEQLRLELQRERIGITITPGNEVRLESAAFVYEHDKEGNFFYLDPGRRFVLLEQPWERYCDDSEEVFQWFLSRGTTPIIPHPERHAFFREQPELLYRLMDMGAWTQVTVDSLIGRNGKAAETFSRRLLERDQIHVLATDAHNTSRKPNLSEGFRLLNLMAGAERSQQILDRMESIRRTIVADSAAAL